MIKLTILAIFALVVAVSAKKKGGSVVHECRTNEFCMAILPQEKNNTYIRCKRAEEGNDSSSRICGVAYDTDPTEPVENPNNKRCSLVTKKKYKEMCSMYFESHNPIVMFNKGRKNALCAKKMTTYGCTVGTKYVLVCAIAVMDCTGTCASKK